MIIAKKFSSTATEQKPQCDTVSFLERISDKPIKKWSRQEKDKLAGIFYGVFGSQFAGYRLMGWEWNFSKILPEFIVHFKHGHYQSFRAADKTALRRNMGIPILRIIAV
jgi:hypothetical protein